MSPIEEIKSRIDPVQLISEYVKLVRAGINWKTLCPFHQEKTPSFFVSPNRGTWRCFGCGKGGDIFTFVMEREGLSFRDALEMLARRAGVEIRPERPEIRKERETLLAICETTAAFFERMLEGKEGLPSGALAKEGERARAYLRERGLKLETVKAWRLGYAPHSWDALFKYLRELGYAPELVEKAGLAIKKEVMSSEQVAMSSYYDRFRSRIMFPISDLVGRVVGFSSRIMPEAENDPNVGGKYVNSPETPLFQKSRILYGLDKTKSDIQRQGAGLLVEGQMDLLLSWQEGFKNVVATSGTALTPRHLSLLRRYTTRLIFAFDQDRAGIRAAERAISLTQAQGFEVRVAVFEEKDPAELARADPEKLGERIEHAVPAMVYYVERSFQEFPQDSIEGKTAIVRNLLPKIKSFSNLIERSHWLEILSERLHVPLATLEGELAKLPLEEPLEFTGGQALESLQESPPAERAGHDEERPDLVSLPKTRVELLSERTATLLLSRPEGARELFTTFETFLPAPWQELCSLILKNRNDSLLQDTPRHLQMHLEGAMLRKEWEEIIGRAEDVCEELSRTLKELKRERSRERIQELTFAIREAERNRDEGVLNSLLEELRALSVEFSHSSQE